MNLKEQIDSLNKILQQVEEINQQIFNDVEELVNNIKILLNKITKNMKINDELKQRRLRLKVSARLIENIETYGTPKAMFLYFITLDDISELLKNVELFIEDNKLINNKKTYILENFRDELLTKLN